MILLLVLMLTISNSDNLQTHIYCPRVIRGRGRPFIIASNHCYRCHAKYTPIYNVTDCEIKIVQAQMGEDYEQVGKASKTATIA